MEEMKKQRERDECGLQGERLWKASCEQIKVEEIGVGEEIGACGASREGGAVAALMKAVRKINESLLEQAAQSRRTLWRNRKTKNTELTSR